MNARARSVAFLLGISTAILCFVLGACAADEPVPPGFELLELHRLREGEWVPFEQLRQDFDDEGRITGGAISFIGLGGEWVARRSIRITYDGDRPIEELNQSVEDAASNRPTGRSLRFRYDGEGRLERIDLVTVTSTPGIERAAGYVGYDYDDRGRVRRKVDGLQEQVERTEYFYDERDRVIEEHISSDLGIVTTVRYTIEDGLLTERIRLNEFESPRQRASRRYDADGLLHTETSSVWGWTPNGSAWRLEHLREISRNPEDRTMMVSTELRDGAQRSFIKFAPDGTMNNFDLPGWPPIVDWDRSLLYPPRSRDP